MITIQEFGDFHKTALSLLGEDAYEALIAHVSIQPESGVIMAGTGGFRKLRWARPGGGKSGGTRVVYYFYDRSRPVSMISIYGKNEKENLSQEEKNEMKQLAALLKGI